NTNIVLDASSSTTANIIRWEYNGLVSNRAYASRLFVQDVNLGGQNMEYLVWLEGLMGSGAGFKRIGTWPTGNGSTVERFLHLHDFQTVDSGGDDPYAFYLLDNVVISSELLFTEDDIIDGNT